MNACRGANEFYRRFATQSWTVDSFVVCSAGVTLVNFLQRPVHAFAAGWRFQLLWGRVEFASDL